MSEQRVLRGPGRPRKPEGRKSRIDITISQEALAFTLWLLGVGGNLSGFIDEQIKSHPRYEEWKQTK